MSAALDMLTREPEDHGDRPPTKEGRVLYLMRLMASGRFERGDTMREICEAWDLAEVTVKQDTAEASRRVKALTDPAWVRARLAETLNHAAEVARSDPKAAAAVANAYAGLVGAAAPSRLQLDVALLARVTDDQWAAMPATQRQVQRVAQIMRQEAAGNPVLEAYVTRVLAALSTPAALPAAQPDEEGA